MFAQYSYLDGLNDDQLVAVKALDGPVLILAGAGTGKTRVLASRLTHILTVGNVDPRNILAVTFTNKAAQEMKERVNAVVGSATKQICLGTFHALCAKILRNHAELVGLKSNFSILNINQQITLIKQILQDLNIEEKHCSAQSVLGILQRWKDRGLTSDKIYSTKFSNISVGNPKQIYRHYQDRLINMNAVDFGDLILHCFTLFQTNVCVLQQYQNQFRYIMVDEYQDTNLVQYFWLRLLAQNYKNICCVGDDDQSVYGWRGAEIGNIINFENDFPGSKVVRLEQNYRSTSRILAVASSVIARNKGRLGKILWTKGNDGEQIIVRCVSDNYMEARVICERIKYYHKTNVPLRGIAVLVRTGFQIRAFEEQLVTLGVPYKTIGAARFYDSKEIRDVISYLQVIAQPKNDLAFERIINVPARRIGKTTERILFQYARINNICLTTAAEHIVQDEVLKPPARQAVSLLMQNFARWRKASHNDSLSTLTNKVINESGYIASLQKDGSQEALERLNNINELITTLEKFISLDNFLEHISLFAEGVDSVNFEQVSLMTLHAAKGLEFEVVFLPGWEEGIFPNQRAIDEKSVSALEEERRLAYVGLTRARKHVEIFFATNRHLHGVWRNAIPSRFISEMPVEHLAMIGNVRVYNANTIQRHCDDFKYTHKNKFRLSSLESSRPVNNSIVHNSDYIYQNHDIVRKDNTKIKGNLCTNEISRFDKSTLEERVFHKKFGMGTIIKADSKGKLEVLFDCEGTKKVLDTFVSRSK
ncbi:excision endonuclease subunit UvrD [Candidatus Endolissoclinum faulkneri L5]|uniref:DNA 3'-5' helicase n=1 Tax=Candidatus Endolissoclinum faulkneri L5 TaxID=1401328 RepID=V9TR06_9PROT|nr:UvrD-helicase domain-containing protein [Candidatus Endolissoclinum faulkneri]AHC73314.1 excision endonuclease subunit UvrD [Candidatus Endolissoclinum faulkneri L5]